jgi:hypothetical protein
MSGLGVGYFRGVQLETIVVQHWDVMGMSVVAGIS